MKRNTLLGLTITALLAIVAAIALQHANAPRSEGGGVESAWLAPGLRDHVNEIGKIVVTGADSKTLATLERGANGWSLAEKGGYAVDTGKLRDFLLKLADAKLVEAKTASKDKYATLGVEDVSAKDAKGVQVELDGLAQPLTLIIGSTNPRGGTFVRRAGDAQSWLASTTLTVDKGSADWLGKDLADIAATRIEAVTITRADGKVVRATKDAEDEANFKLADVPKGREVSSEFAVNGLASTLAGLRFDDVLPAKDATPDDKALKARYALFDGLVVDVTAWQHEGKDFAQFAASLDAAQADKGIVAAQAKAKAEFEAAAAKPEGDKDAAEAIKPLAVSDPAKDRDDRLAALNKQVADLNARFHGWTFVLPAYKYANIDKPLEDLLKPVEDKQPAAKKPAKAGK